MIDRLRLYLVADPDHCRGSLVDAIGAALSGGVTAVQLRAKHLADRDVAALGRRIRELTASHDALYIVNDRVDIALATSADGVHPASPTSIPMTPASRHRIHHRLLARRRKRPAGAGTCDYYGIGPVFGG